MPILGYFTAGFVAEEPGLVESFLLLVCGGADACALHSLQCIHF